MLLGGHKGHLAMMDWNRFNLVSEFHVRETTRDVAVLHNYSLYATAQKKYVYIYDKDGVELHVLRNHIQPNVLDFLPYHFLLVSVGQAGYLKYQVSRWWARGGRVCGLRVTCRSLCLLYSPRAGHVHGPAGGRTPHQARRLPCHAPEPVQCLHVPWPWERCVNLPSKCPPWPGSLPRCCCCARHRHHVDAEHEPAGCEDAVSPWARCVYRARSHTTWCLRTSGSLPSLTRRHPRGVSQFPRSASTWRVDTWSPRAWIRASRCGTFEPSSRCTTTSRPVQCTPLTSGAWSRAVVEGRGSCPSATLASHMPLPSNVQST